MMIARTCELDKSNVPCELEEVEVFSNRAENLKDFVLQSARNGARFDEAERGVWRQLLALGNASMSLFLQAQGNGDLGESVSIESGSVLNRSDSIQPRPVRSIFGEHCFEAFVYSQGANEKIELRPIDARLNLPECKASYLFQEFSQMFCVEKAFGVAAQQFETVFQQKVSVGALVDINRTMGRKPTAFLTA